MVSEIPLVEDRPRMIVVYELKVRLSRFESPEIFSRALRRSIRD